ncbi:MAG: hypothetical protein P4L90_24920 [Rhodopila sp.]|nr:hypothetical protein [Rhodopila sp.]
MSSSISSSDPPDRWRRFFRRAAGTAAIVVCALYAFVVLVDPWGSLPLTLPLDRTPVTSNQRFSYPVLARSPLFDSAIFGTSTSRLLRPADLNPAFGARFANLAMNDATPYEMSSLLRVFNRAHPAAKVVMLGVDSPWCVTGNSFQKLTPRPFPEWMYGTNRWRGYAEMFNLFAVQEAGKAFGVLTGLKKPDMGRDGYTSFVPPDSTYDPARAAMHLREAAPRVPGGERAGAPGGWRFPALDLLREDLAALPAGSHKVLFFTPYNHRLFSVPGSDGALVWDECKRRVAALARATPNATAVDFMLPSPITEVDDNYWDPLHYRVGVADRLAHDLIAADRGDTSPDYRLLSDDRGL